MLKSMRDDLEAQLATEESGHLLGRTYVAYFDGFRSTIMRKISLKDCSPVTSQLRALHQRFHAFSIRLSSSSFPVVGLVIKKTLPSGGTGRSSWNGKGGQVDYSGKKMTPGMIMELGAGDDVEVVDPKGAATDATAFLKTQQGLIGAGQGLSYEAVSRDMSGATYSSARQNALEDENTYTEEIELLTAFMSEVYENFLISGVLSGLFSVPDFWERKEDYMDHSWVKAPKKWIDPAKEASADKIALQSGQKTFQDLQAEKGKDWKEAVDELAEVLDVMVEQDHAHRVHAGQVHRAGAVVQDLHAEIAPVWLLAGKANCPPPAVLCLRRAVRLPRQNLPHAPDRLLLFLLRCRSAVLLSFQFQKLHLPYQSLFCGHTPRPPPVRPRPLSSPCPFLPRGLVQP